MTTITLLPIPAGSRATECSSCHQRIFFAPHPKTGRPHPISVADSHAQEPTATENGWGITHFADCPNAAQHRAPRKAH